MSAAERAPGRTALAVDGLRVVFPTARGELVASNNVSFAVRSGQTLGVVGESGCGKSVTLRALCGLVPPPGRIVEGSIEIDGRRCETAAELAAARGDTVSMIFQDPGTSLDPVMSIGDQIGEVLRVKVGLGRRESRRRSIELLEHVGIPEAPRRLRAFPHELSGGMRQRVMIAMAIAPEPRVLLADEPTTALDVTTQEQILKLLERLQAETGMAIVLVTHDLGVVEDTCDDVVVMYAGYVIERGSVNEVTQRPRHPYTRGLLSSMPRLTGTTLPEAIPGQPPDMAEPPRGCPFAPRCREARPECAGIDMERETERACACPFALSADADAGPRAEATRS